MADVLMDGSLIGGSASAMARGSETRKIPPEQPCSSPGAFRAGIFFGRRDRSPDLEARLARRRFPAVIKDWFRIGGVSNLHMALGMWMPIRVRTFRAAILCFSALLPACADAEGIDTEHLFGFMIGADVGNVGEREFQSQTTGRFAKDGGKYRAVGQEFELEFVPVRNFRVELGGAFAGHDIRAVPGLEDRRQLAWQGVAVDLRYRFLERDSAPFGLTFAVESGLSRIDGTSGAAVRNFETEFRLAFDRELIPNYAVAALNLIYQPEWTRFQATGAAERESTIGAALGAMVRVRPDVLVGGEARYLRRYEGIGLEEFSGQAFFVGPTVYFQLSPRARLTAAWSVQAWGRSAGSRAALDLVNFERHQGRLVFGVNF